MAVLSAKEMADAMYSGDRFIVAEISKNWQDGQEVVPTGPLHAIFEQVINFNWHRGYRLHSFQLHRLMTGPSSVNETIIAVFEVAG